MHFELTGPFVSGSSLVFIANHATLHRGMLRIVTQVTDQEMPPPELKQALPGTMGAACTQSAEKNKADGESETNCSFPSMLP